jgi:hypothetical protein
MKLPFFLNQSAKKDVYLGLFLKEEEGIALVMINEQGRLVIKEKENFKYTNGWENLVEDVDEALYKLEKNHSLELNKTIFFVYSHLVDERTNDIKKPFLGKIKDLVKKLELEVYGYIECFEAVSFYLEKKEEVSLTAVLMELDKNQLSLFVYKGGKINYRRSVARTDNIIDDFLVAIEGIKGRAMLPSRIILYDSDNIDDAAVKIVSHRWNTDYFTQIPKIDTLQEEMVLEGLVDVFAGQIKTTEPEIKENQSLSNKEFGFVIGQDVGDIEEESHEVPDSRPVFKQPFQMPKLPQLSLPKIDWSFLKILKGRFGVILGLVIIITSIILNEYFFHRAQLTIYLPSQTIKKTFSESIEFKTASSGGELSDSTSTTGKRQIGEKAKGGVNLHNFDNNEKVFAKGTTLSANSLDFILENDVKVASSTVAADGSAKLPGKSAGSVVAVNIGPESNLGKGQRFKIGDLAINDYFAINDSAFSGGSKREIRAVSENDQNKLEKNILSKASKQAKPPALDKNETIADLLTETDMKEKKFSHDIGEEADDLKLTAGFQTVYYIYNKENLDKKIREELNSDLKKGFLLNNLNYKIVEAEITKNDLLKFELDINTKAIKQYNQEEIAKKILGKTRGQVETILKSGSEIRAFDISISEPIPIFKNFLPIFKKNITLKISSFE